MINPYPEGTFGHVKWNLNQEVRRIRDALAEALGRHISLMLPRLLKQLKPLKYDIAESKSRWDLRKHPKRDQFKCRMSLDRKGKKCK